MSAELPSVFILDDHVAVREGIKSILAGSGRYGVAGQAPSASEARLALESLEHEGALPGVILVDINLKGQSGIDFMRSLSAAYPSIAPIVISVSLRFDSIVEAFAAGAKGYIAKDQDDSSIIRVLDAVARGQLGIEGEPLSVLAENAVRLSAARAGLERSRYDGLTPREKEVFRLTALNADAKAIAAELDISVKTVENLKSSIRGKLGLADRFELYKYALRIGIVEE